MTLPDWWEATLLGLAAYRTWRAAAIDKFADRPRARLLDPRPRLDSFVSCPLCLGGWMAVGWWTSWQVWPETLDIAALAAVTLAPWLVASVMDRDTD